MRVWIHRGCSVDSDEIVLPKESMNGNCERCQMEGPLWAYDASEMVFLMSEKQREKAGEVDGRPFETQPAFPVADNETMPKPMDDSADLSGMVDGDAAVSGLEHEPISEATPSEEYLETAGEPIEEAQSDTAEEPTITETEDSFIIESKPSAEDLAALEEEEAKTTKALEDIKKAKYAKIAALEAQLADLQAKEE